MNGITFNGFHSYKDKSLTIAPGRKIGRPSKEKKKHKPPFSNTEFDFSKLYGVETYTNRVLTYPFNLTSKSKKAMSLEAMDIVQWLTQSDGKQKLYDDAIPGFHFLAEVETEISFQENWQDGVLTVNFLAYPFMIKNIPEGSPNWDDYTVYDLYQEVDFSVSGEKTIELFNGGIPDMIPVITASSPFIIKKDGNLYEIPVGTSESLDFFLYPGNNKMEINGVGIINFLFRKEVI